MPQMASRMISDASSLESPSEELEESSEVTTPATSSAKSVQDTKSLWKTMFGKKKIVDDDGKEKLTTRQQLAKLGLAAVLSYGWVSNMSYCICVSIAWYGFSKQVRRNSLTLSLERSDAMDIEMFNILCVRDLKISGLFKSVFHFFRQARVH
jgi:hypothetical protein